EGGYAGRAARILERFRPDGDVRGPHQRNEGARHDVLAGTRDTGEVLESLGPSEVTGRRVADAVRVDGEDLLDVVGGDDARRLFESTQLRCVETALLLRVHPQPRELEVGVVDDPAQGVSPHVP